MQRRTIPVPQHPSYEDPTAHEVASEEGEMWQVFSVQGGFMAATFVDGRYIALEGLFADLDEARRAAAALVGEGA